MKLTCSGSCNKNKGGGWTRNPETGYWVCGGCERPTEAFLKQCGICEEFYLPNIYQPNTGIELDHEECLEELTEGVAQAWRWEPDDTTDGG